MSSPDDEEESHDLLTESPVFEVKKLMNYSFSQSVFILEQNNDTVILLR